MAEKQVQQYKIDAVAGFKERFAAIKDVLFADYRGLTVEQITELRRQLREVGAEFHVIKNAYAQIAFQQLEREEVIPYLVGPTAIAYSGNEAGPLAKVILDFARNAPVEIKGGFVDGRVYDAAGMEAFSKLPTKMELVQRLMGTMTAPLGSVVCILHEITAALARSLAAVRDKKKSEG